MKYTNIKKLIIKFIGGGIVNFPTRWIKWIKINSCDCDGGGDSGGDGGDTPSSINLNDFRNFDISLVVNDYRSGYNAGDVMPIDSFFNVSSMDIFKGLSILSNNVGNSSETTFDLTVNDGSGGSYYHRIYITPGGEDYQINVDTSYNYTDEETGDVYDFHYNVQFIVNVDNETLQIVNISEGGE